MSTIEGSLEFTRNITALFDVSANWHPIVSALPTPIPKMVVSFIAEHFSSTKTLKLFALSIATILMFTCGALPITSRTPAAMRFASAPLKLCNGGELCATGQRIWFFEVSKNATGLLSEMI